MEAEIAKVLWSRSIDKHKFRYTTMLSDGDACTFSTLKDLMPYGDAIPIEKIDCINHAEKRMGTALRNAAKIHGLGGKKAGSLTVEKANKLQKYYGRAIRGNIGEIENMRTAIWASLFHSLSTDDDPHHSRCPDGPDSWCSWKKAQALGLPAPKQKCSTALSRPVAEKLVPIYQRMSEKALLERLLHGATQNANESLNNLIWVHCPKTTFVGLQKVRTGVAMGVARFNAGAIHTIEVMRNLGIEPTEVCMLNTEKEDANRIAKAKRADDKKEKEIRSMKQTARKLQLARLEDQEGSTYAAGSF
jgi:hypothetical protein